MKAIADTGLLVAFLNRKDTHHNWAVDIAQSVTDPLLTCEAVLAEAAFHTANAALVLDLVHTGFVRVAFDLSKHESRIRELAIRYSDRKPDLADLCLIRLSELHPRHSVITTDVTDFRVYRRNRRDVIPLVTPPERDQPK